MDMTPHMPLERRQCSVGCRGLFVAEEDGVDGHGLKQIQISHV
jgi:hypothetical protein